MKKMSEATWKKIQKPLVYTVLAWAIMLTFVSCTGPVALLGVASKDNAYEAANTYARLEFQATNYLTVWLSGDKGSAQVMKSMTGRENLPEFNDTPAVIQPGSINVSDITPPEKSADQKDVRTTWVTLGVSFSSLGNQNSTRMYYRIPYAISKDGGVTALALPQVTNNLNPSLSIKYPWQGSIAIDSPVGNAVTNFVVAYYGKNTSGSLGRYVTGDFDSTERRETIKDSPYTTVEVLAIAQQNVVSDPAAAKAGDTLEVQATVKLATAPNTFVNMEVMLELKKQDNGQWLVNSVVDEPLVGAVK